MRAPAVPALRDELAAIQERHASGREVPHAARWEGGKMWERE
jgi:hypothetical protein